MREFWDVKDTSTSSQYFLTVLSISSNYSLNIYLKVMLWITSAVHLLSRACVPVPPV